MVVPKAPGAQDLVVLREILQRELETINAYEAMIDRVEDPLLKQIVEHITDEEREHVAEMYQLIMERDVRQQERSRRSAEQLGQMGSVAAAGPHAAASTASAAPATNSVDATAVAAAGLSDPLLLPVGDDPVPPPPPIFPEGAWSVGGLKHRDSGKGAPTSAEAAEAAEAARQAGAAGASA